MLYTFDNPKKVFFSAGKLQNILEKQGITISHRVEDIPNGVSTSRSQIIVVTTDSLSESKLNLLTNIISQQEEDTNRD